MSTPKVSRVKVIPLHPTLADLTITWDDGGRQKVATGRQLARLLAVASLEAPSGLFAVGHDAGVASSALRGLVDLLYPDARDPDALGEDARGFIAESLTRLAALVDEEQLHAEDTPARFAVHMKRGSGLPAQAYIRPAARRRPR